MRRWLALAAGVLSSAGQAWGADVVSLGVPEELIAAPGRRVVAEIQVTVKPGYHVQANPVLNPDLIPLTLEIKSAHDAHPGKPTYPPAKRLRLEGDSVDLVVYDGSFTVRNPIRLSKDAAPGTRELNGTLRYQACDDRHCLFPTTLPFTLRLRVGQP